MHLGDRQLAPVRIEVLAPALEFALPTVAVAETEAGLGIEQLLGKVLQGRQIGDALAADFLGAVQGDGGKARVDVLHPTVAVDQQEGAGALLDRALEQMQGAGGGAPLLVEHGLGLLIDRQGALQVGVLRLQVIEPGVVRRAWRLLINQQIAVQQRPQTLLETLATLQNLQGAEYGMQGVAHLIVVGRAQLLLDLGVQLIACLGLHQAGEG